MKARPFLAFTIGDPAGVGPSVSAAAALHAGLRRLCRPLLVGDASAVRRFAARPGLRVRPIADLADYRESRGAVNVLHVAHPRIAELAPGRPQKIGGEAAFLAVRAAAGLAMQKRAAAVVTGPVSKESLKLAGVPFPGHTELLAALSGARQAEMLMCAGPLRAVLVTRHLPLKDVPAALSAESIVASVRRADAWLRRALGLRRPRWAVCGLNPHAGDNGLIGREERRVVAPAAARLRRLGVNASDPLPADAAWAAHAKGEYDAVACLYHDQGMIPLKALHPRAVVNVTVGLPWVRTSPGHGTAYDLAAARPPFRDADPSATIAAAFLALEIAGRKRP